MMTRSTNEWSGKGVTPKVGVPFPTSERAGSFFLRGVRVCAFDAHTGCARGVRVCAGTSNKGQNPRAHPRRLEEIIPAQTFSHSDSTPEGLRRESIENIAIVAFLAFGCSEKCHGSEDEFGGTTRE